MWVKPTFEPSVVIIISLLVVMLSVPVNVIVRNLIEVLKAPTPQEVEVDVVVTKERRKSAVLNLKVNQQPSMHRPQALTLLEEAGSSGGAKGRKRSMIGSTNHFAPITQSNVELQEKHEGTKQIRQKLLKQHSKFQKESTYDIENILKELTAHEVTLGGRERQRFRAHWGLQQSPGSTMAPDDADNLRAELDLVRETAVKTLERMHEMPPMEVGVEILRLFAMDLLGRDTSKAKVFENQLENFDRTVIVTWAIKGLTLSVSEWEDG